MKSPILFSVVLVLALALPAGCAAKGLDLTGDDNEQGGLIGELRAKVTAQAQLIHTLQLRLTVANELTAELKAKNAALAQQIQEIHGNGNTVNSPFVFAIAGLVVMVCVVAGYRYGHSRGLSRGLARSMNQ